MEAGYQGQGRWSRAGADSRLKVIIDLMAGIQNNAQISKFSSRLQRSGCLAEPTLLAVGDNMQLLAIGYDDGAIMLHRGDITRERGTKVKMILEPGPHLASLAFKVAETGVFLYTATAQDVILINVTTKDRETKSVLDSLGCASGDLCVAPLNMPETHFAVGQPDAVYCYNAEGRGQCYAFEGAKRLLSW